MRIAHLSDIHWSDKYLDEVRRVTEAAADHLHRDRVELIVLSGDLFDHRLEQNSPAYLEAVEWVCRLGGLAPVLILQGTLSHDAPRAIEVFRSVDTTYKVYVADRIEQVMLSRNGERPCFDRSPSTALSGDMLLISCLPSVNKGQVAAAVGAENAAEAVGEAVATLLAGWAYSHRQARAVDTPSIVVSHGTVSGALTEHGVPMMGLDHEFTTGALFAADASAVMLGHIHKAQEWERNGHRIAYAGSLGRLHFGEHDPKGFLIWDVQADSASYEFIETPARKLLEVEFTGPPDMAELERLAVQAGADVYVRIRYAVDDEHRHSVDKDAINALFAGAAQTKIEGRILPVQRQRAAGIGQAVSTADKLRRWGEITDTDTGPLLERLALLEAGPQAQEEAA